MDTVWLGVKLAIGLAVGFVVIAILLRLIAKVRAFIVSARFVSAGCVYQPSGVPGAPSGWLIRDITNDDWVLWDERNQRPLRSPADAPPEVAWRVSNETMREFLSLARQERDYWSKSAEAPPEKIG